MTLGWDENDEERGEDDSGSRKQEAGKVDSGGNVEGLRKLRGSLERISLEQRQGQTIIIPKESIHAS